MIAPYVIAGVLLLTACGCAHGVFWWLRKAYVMSRWPTVTGKISSSWAVLDGERIIYDYAVAGHSYVGHRVWWTLGRSTADPDLQELAEKYPPGRDVTVYYDPAHPATAVLEPSSLRNAAMSTLFMVAFGIVFLAIGLAHR